MSARGTKMTGMIAHIYDIEMIGVAGEYLAYKIELLFDRHFHRREKFQLGRILTA